MSSDDEDIPLAVPISITAASDHSAPHSERPTPPPVTAHPLDQDTKALPQVPVLLLTGFLGAGKTTLVNYILQAQHGYRCAVLLNEFADSADVERALVKEPEDNEASPLADWVQLENGCICCSAKNNMVQALESLLQQRERFDYLIIETTGLANPAPVAAALWTDAGLESSVCLDAIVTVTDAKHIMQQLADPRPDGAVNEAQQQVASADIVLLNKTDLVGDEELIEIEREIKGINSTAIVVRCERCRIDLGRVLNTGAYTAPTAALLDIASTDDDSNDDVSAAAAANDAVEGEAANCSKPQCQDHSHHHHYGTEDAKQQQTPQHAHQIHSVTVIVQQPVSLLAVRHWLDELLWEEENKAEAEQGKDQAMSVSDQSNNLNTSGAAGHKKEDILRIKGLLYVSGSDSQFVVQGVHDIYDVTEGSVWQVAREQRYSKLVFIGRFLKREKLSHQLQACCVFD